MKERRRHKRYSIRISGRASDDSHQDYEFITNNISAGGMNMTTDGDLADESTVTLRLDMPEVLPRAKRLQGVVVRKKKEEPGFSYGIRFFGLSEKETEEIDASLRNGHFAALAQPVENPAETK